MKIIWRHNSDHAQPERLVADNIVSMREAEVMLAALRSGLDHDSPDWYDLLPKEYKLGNEGSYRTVVP